MGSRIVGFSSPLGMASMSDLLEDQKRMSDMTGEQARGLSALQSRSLAQARIDRQIAQHQARMYPSYRAIEGPCEDPDLYEVKPKTFREELQKEVNDWLR